MIRYEEVTEHCIQLTQDIIANHFPDLTDIKIKFLFDTKKRTHGGRLVLGKCQKPNELTRHFSLPETKDPDGYQYVITIDKVAWELAEDTDRIRLLRHELRHVDVIQDEETRYRILPHNIEDFVEEVELNADDPDWARKVGAAAKMMYKKK